MHLVRRAEILPVTCNGTAAAAEYRRPTPPAGGWSAWYRTDEDDMGESIEQGLIVRLLLAAVTELARMRGWAHCLVASDQFFAWVEEEPLVRVSPDVYLLDHPRRPYPDSWQTWRAGHSPPRFAVEVVSSKHRKDYEEAPPKYEQLGTRELVVFDPHAVGRIGERTPLQVFRRDADGWRRVAHGDGPVYSAELDAWLVVVPGPRLRVALDEAGQALVPTPDELVSAAQAENAELRADIAALRADNVALRAENAELRAENAELRTENAALRAENAALRAENAELRAENATLRAENAELRQELARATETIAGLETKVATLEGIVAAMQAEVARMSARMG